MPPSSTPRFPQYFRQFSSPRFWPIWLLLGWLRLLSWLPLPLVYLLGALLGEIAYGLHRPRRKITLRNLSTCFPDKSPAEIRALARGHFRNLTISLLAIGIPWWSSEARLARLTRLKNREIFDQSKARGENLILLTPHVVGLEHGGMYLFSLAPTLTMYQRNSNPLLDTLIKHYRSRFGAILFARRDTLRPLLRELRAGRQFYYLPDQDPGTEKSVFAPFYGVSTATFGALGRLARLGNATIIPCVTRVLPWGRGFEIFFGKPLTDIPGDDDVAAATRMNRVLEELIAHAPQQYFWSHKRFKTRPPGELPFYE